MENHYGRLGLVTLVLSLSFYILGAIGAVSASSENFFLAQSGPGQEQIDFDFPEHNEDCLLQRQVANQKLSQISKIPVFYKGVVLCLFGPKIAASQRKQLQNGFYLSHTTDLWVRYLNLRI